MVRGEGGEPTTGGSVAGGDTTTDTVQTGDIETYYERRGDGPPIVFIHGMFMSTTEWGPQVDTLSDEFTTITYDVRGHGHTGGSDRDPYSMDLYAADLGALLSELDIENPILCGLSMGGCIAQVYAAAHPDRVAGLVLSDTFTAAPLPLSGRLIFSNLRFFALLDRVIRYPTLNKIQLRVGNLLSPGIATDADRIQRLVEDAPRISHAEFAKIARAMARFPESDFDGSEIDVPVLLLYGEHAPKAFRTMHTRLAESLTNADVAVTVVPDAGHASNIDNPAFFTAEVREFAHEVTGATGDATAAGDVL